METIFKVGDKVFDINFGWGKVTDVNPGDNYPIYVKFKRAKRCWYTNKGEYLLDSPPTLSFTEYKLNGFSQERPIDYNEWKGKWCAFWGDNYSIGFTISRYGGYAYGMHYSATPVSYDNARLLTEEEIKNFGLD